MEGGDDKSSLAGPAGHVDGHSALGAGVKGHGRMLPVGTAKRARNMTGHTAETRSSEYLNHPPAGLG